MMLRYLLCYKWCTHFFNLLKTTDLNKNVHKSHLLKLSCLLQPSIVRKMTMNYFFNILFLTKHPLKFLTFLLFFV